MKKYFLIICTVLLSIIITGCGKYDTKNFVKDLEQKIANSKSYKLKGELEIINNEDSYTYDVEVSFLKENNFKVNLKNKINNYEQIILRNSDGVYVLTPSLNKSFKFQSEWPYNSSQSYLLQTILQDIKDDEQSVIETTDDGFIITTKVKYTSNKELQKQKIYINKDKDIKKIEVLDNDGIAKIKMIINSLEYNYNFDDQYFKLNNETKETENTTSTLDNIIYPMYMPENTYLSSENKVNKENGERVIMTFSGDNPFILVQETANIESTLNITPTNGDPCMISGIVGNINDNSVEWINNGIEYYLMSEKLSKEDLLNVAKSLTTMPVSK